jgi:hypothetical protein
MAPPARDELAALRQRLENVDAELDDVRQRARRLGALERDRSSLEAERAELARRLASYERVPALEGLRIASPCDADWGAMRGDDRVRFCGACQKNVYNFAGMARVEIEELLRANEGGEICARMYRRDDGTVLTSDCPDGARRKRRRLALLGAGAGVVAASAAATASLWPREPTPAEPLAHLAPPVGSVSVPLTPPPFEGPPPDATTHAPGAPIRVTAGRLPIRPRDQLRPSATDDPAKATAGRPKGVAKTAPATHSGARDGSRRGEKLRSTASVRRLRFAPRALRSRT